MAFDMDPSAAVGIVGLGVLYWIAARVLRRRPRRRQLFFFCLALVALAIAQGPLDELSDRGSFWGHMVEHSFQCWVVPPLLLLGVPDWMLRPWVIRRWILPLARALTHPVAAFLIFTGVYAGAHVPVVFNLMTDNDAFHIAMHLAFLISGTLLWWPLMSQMPELPPLPYPQQVLYLFLLMIPMTAVAAPITLSTSVVYPWYAHHPHPFGLAPLEDQVLGGIVMWVADSIYLIFVFTWIFYRWSLSDTVEEPRLVRPTAPVRLAAAEPRPGA